MKTITKRTPTHKKLDAKENKKIEKNWNGSIMQRYEKNMSKKMVGKKVQDRVVLTMETLTKHVLHIIIVVIKKFDLREKKKNISAKT